MPEVLTTACDTAHRVVEGVVTLFSCATATRRTGAAVVEIVISLDEVVAAADAVNVLFARAGFPGGALFDAFPGCVVIKVHGSKVYTT